MLLEFKVKNYKSFLDEVCFSMIPASKQKGLDYSVMVEKVKSKDMKGLCSSVVYGSNASGKTNIISAMDVLRSIVLRGNIRNTKDNTPNHASNTLELIPNKDLNEVEPICFSIAFIENNMKFLYELKITVGLFLDTNYERKVVSEELFVNDACIFERADTVKLHSMKTIKSYISEDIFNHIDYLGNILNVSISNDELFLTNGFKMLTKDLTRIITNWFENKLIVIYRADAMKVSHKLSKDTDKSIFIDKNVEEATKLIGASANDIGYISEDDDVKLCSILEKEGKHILIDANVYESYGTIRFINLIPLLIQAIQLGTTLIVDELDTLIHPIALMSIVNVLHNDEINKKHAQLIFNTHNPIFLNSNVFRRDEIKFVERDEETNISTLYALSDFKTSGENGVRNRYGAIKDIDFTRIFENVIKSIPH